MRRRYIYREVDGQMQAVEVTPDYQRYAERQPIYTDRYMDGVQATDGTDIGSRTKRREYMQANNLADADDFKDTWAKAQAQRESERLGVYERGRREVVAATRDAIRQLMNRRR